MSSTKCSDFFALIDCNNFFASCEQVFNPRLERKPLVILSNNDGVIISRSQKAKEFGIKMGDPAFLHRQAVEKGELVMLSANFSLYADLSQRIMCLLQGTSSHLEIYSIDEAFLLLSRKKAWDQALSLKKHIKQCTGIPVSIGIGETKTLAKLSNANAKTEPNGIFLLSDPKARENILMKTSVQEIWGIGGKSSERLKRAGIYSAFQLQQAEETRIQKILGITGVRTALELRGISCLELSEVPEKKQSIVCSRSFGMKVSSLPFLHEAIATFTADAAERLREQNSLAGFLSVSLISSQGWASYDSHLPIPSSYTPELIAIAKEATSHIYSPNLNYKKAHILLSNFCDEEAKPQDFFALESNRGKKEKAMKILDQINARYNKQVLSFAAEGIKKPWKGKSANISPKYTTDWNDLLKVT